MRGMQKDRMDMIEHGVWVTEDIRRGQEEKFKIMFQASVWVVERMTRQFSFIRNVEFKDIQVWIQNEAAESDLNLSIDLGAVLLVIFGSMAFTMRRSLRTKFWVTLTFRGGRRIRRTGREPSR